MAKIMLKIKNPKNGDPVPKESAYARRLIAIEKDIEQNLPLYEKQSKEFYTKYLNSPKYKERLIGQGYERPDDAIKLRLANMNVTGSKKHWGKETMYGVPDQKVYLNPATFNDNPDLKLRSTVAHEYSHVTGAMIPEQDKIPFPMKMNEQESHEIERRNKYRKLSGDQWNKLPTEVKLDSIHDMNPNETKADIDAVRFMLHSDGIYDTGTQEFDKNILQKAKSKYSDDKIMKRLQKNYSDEDIIWMMNKIAKNEKPKKIILKVGGKDSSLT